MQVADPTQRQPWLEPRGWESVGAQSLLLMATLGLAPGAPLGCGCQLPFLQLPLFSHASAWSFLLADERTMAVGACWVHMEAVWVV